MLIRRAGGIDGVFARQAEVIEIEAVSMRAIEPVRKVRAPEGRVVVLLVEAIGALFAGTSEKGQRLPFRALVEQLRAIELERDIRRRACRDQPSGTQAHAKATETHGELLLLGEQRNDIDEGKLQVGGIVLDGRRGLSSSHMRPEIPST